MSGYYSVSYSEILPVLLEAFHQLIQYHEENSLYENLVLIDESVLGTYHQLQTKGNLLNNVKIYTELFTVLNFHSFNVNRIVNNLFDYYPVIKKKKFDNFVLYNMLVIVFSIFIVCSCTVVFTYYLQPLKSPVSN